jgi:glycine cleavage system aminomethyltransferase T
LGARDTLRLEMGYPLFGHELSEDITPIEAGLSFFVKLDKEEFVGRATLARQKKTGPERKLVSFRMTGKSPPPRQGYEIFVSEETHGHNDLKYGQEEPMIGTVTSGTQSPSLRCGIGLARIQARHARPGGTMDVQIRGKLHPAVVCKKPLYIKQ